MKVPYSIPMPNNMGMVRYLLAFAVVVAHFNGLVGADIRFPFTSYTAVGGFFALSGFLIYGSYLRKRNLRAYIVSRMVRLLPAYFFIVLACAFGLVFVSSLSAQQYFTSPEFWKYLGANLTFMNFLQPTLPGVFDGLESPAVNGSLWTLKIEWMLYLSVPLTVWVVSKLKGRATLTFLMIFLISVAYRIVFRHLYEATGVQIYEILGRQMFGQLTYFYCGVLIYYWFDVFMRYRRVLLPVSLILILFPVHRYDLDILIDPVAFSTFVICLSMWGKWGTWEGKRDNVSYNMYLVHCPICQLAACFGLKSLVGMWGCFFLVVAATILLSIFISRCIELPIRKQFTRPHSGRDVPSAR